MPIPDYQSIMLPLLKFAGDKKEHLIREAIEHIANIFNLSEEERRELLPSGKQPIIDNRVGWSRTHLKKAGLLKDGSKKGYFQITERGIEILNEKPIRIDVKFLKHYPEYVDFITIRKEESEEEGEETNLAQTPQELLEYGYQRIKKDLASELLNLVKKSSPHFFEKLVVELLIKMGYGGSRKDAGQAIGQSGDGGIDGIIKEDKLGLDVIYIQAKRWENVVGSKEIRNFVGSLVGQKANKGVFITTSGFTKDALEYVKTITHKVILIGGETLTQLMIENNIGYQKLLVMT